MLRTASSRSCDEALLTTMRRFLRDGFLSYCWYLADVAGLAAAADRVAVVADGIRRTLAWQQLPDHIRNRWLALAELVCAVFENADEGRRRRWARSGMKLSANLTLESVAVGATAAVDALEPAQLVDPVAVLEAILRDGRLMAILGLVDPRDFRFKTRRYGAVTLAEVDVLALVLDWVRGAPLADLAEAHLAEVDPEDEPLRFEQLSTFLARICEHHLPFTLGTLLEWTGANLGFDILPALPSHVHYGVPHAHGIELLNRGVRSRRLAVVTGDLAQQLPLPVEKLREWIADLGPANWRGLLDAGPVEVADLLQYVHDPDAAISAALLEGETRQIQVEPTTLPYSTADELAIAAAVGDEEERPRPLVVVNAAGEPVARIRAAEYRHLTLLSEIGAQLIAEPCAWTDEGRVTSVMIRAVIN